MKRTNALKFILVIVIIGAIGSMKFAKDIATTKSDSPLQTTIVSQEESAEIRTASESTNQVVSSSSSTVENSTPLNPTESKSVVAKDKMTKDFSNVGDDNLNIEDLKKYNVPIFLDFRTEDCPACKEFQPIMDKLSKEFYGKAIIKTINVDTSKLIGAQYPIKVVPTQVLISSDGNPYTPKVEGIPGFLGYSKQNSTALDLTTHEGTMTEKQMRDVLKDMGLK